MLADSSLDQISTVCSSHGKSATMSELLMRHTRRPWDFEKYYICRNTNDYYTNLSITAYYNHKFDRRLLSSALRNLILKNPTFTLNCFRQEGDPDDDEKENGDNYIIRPISQISFDDVVIYKPIKVFDNTNLSYLDSLVFPMVTEAPLWRIVLQDCSADEKTYVSFVCDHCFFDGAAAVQFHADLVEELCQVSSETKYNDTLFCYEQDKATLASILPSENEIVDVYDLTPWFTFKSLLKLILIPKIVLKLVNSYLNPNSPNLFKNPVFTSKIPFKPQPKSLHRVINFPSEQNNQIVKFCKLNGIGVTSYFSSCGLLSLQETLLPKFGNKTKFSMKYAIPFCARKYYPKIQDKLKYGVFVASLTGILPPIAPPTADTILACAQSLNKKIKQAVAERTIFKLVGLLKFVNIWQYLQISNDDEHTTMEISNLGLKNISVGDWKITDLIFRGCIGVTTDFEFNIVTTETGGANVCFTYRNEFSRDLTEGDVDQFVEYFSTKVLEGTK